MTCVEFACGAVGESTFTSKRERSNICRCEAIPPWSRGTVAAAVSSGPVKGDGDGTFRASRFIHCPEMAVISKCLG
ncbi:S-layer homology domain-containing protein [Paenibacillus sp. sgz302251]|uniref:S-layer homology domain-containing protein n=1 Tax=Paenibacillus sp. sgz302251 TaxID=3414493 RepID=UPI003C7AB520